MVWTGVRAGTALRAIEQVTDCDDMGVGSRSAVLWGGEFFMARVTCLPP